MSTACCTSDWVYARGTVDYLQAEVETRNGVVLDTQVVEMSFDGTNWVTGTWLGVAGTTRVVEALMDFGDYRATYHVRVRVTNTPAMPIFYVGTVEVR
jgi:hypothetical protein